jgi:hypothetical protein
VPKKPSGQGKLQQYLRRLWELVEKLEGEQQKEALKLIAQGPARKHLSSKRIQRLAKCSDTYIGPKALGTQAVVQTELEEARDQREQQLEVTMKCRWW